MGFIDAMVLPNVSSSDFRIEIKEFMAFREGDLLCFVYVSLFPEYHLS